MVDASTNSTSTRVTSAITRTSGAVIPSLRKPSPKGPEIIPTETNTIAPETGDRSSTLEKSPNAKINRAAKTKTG